MKILLSTLCLLLATSLSLAEMKTKPGEAGKPHAGTAEAPSVFDAPQPVGTKATCPVSGEQFTIKAKTMHVEHKGKHVYFCCPDCKPDFEKAKDAYISAGLAASKKTP